MDKNNLTKAEKIIKEIEQNLSKMTNEEREIFFKEMGFVFIEETPKERKQQLINLLTTLKAVLELKKEQQKPKSGMEEMIEMLGLQGCLIPSPAEEHIDIAQENLRILGVQIDEDVRQCEQAMQESVTKLIKGPKL